MKQHLDNRAHRYLDIFPEVNGQINISDIYPGTICAFHKHKNQTDYWVVVRGALEVIIVPESLLAPPCDAATSYILEDGRVYSNEYTTVLSIPLEIPPNHWHGYRCVGSEKVLLVYYTTKKI